MTRLESKVAVVTGAGRGLGAAVCQWMAKEGATVVAADIDSVHGQRCADDLGERTSFIELDVTSEQSWDSAVSAIMEKFGRIDVLVNNAGLVWIAPLVDTSLADYHRLVAVNQTGPYLGMRAVLPVMTKAGRGSIVNVSSMNGIRGMPGESIYSATKHAVIGMTRSVALEVAELGIRVNAVCPGAMDTPMLEEVDLGAGDGKSTAEALAPLVPFKRVASAAEVAEVVGFLASDASSYCSGAEFVADGAWTSGLSFS
ncbi:MULTISPECIES: glucose 1-dehydrogenase [Mycolicibacterium]|uniref:glucose 1-dehydrogenase n=1 Tax=Mycolicibacterium TaxID=1866885 RepID=UPI00148F6622|nr:SDR family oxidoreductase [Mycolicibacterium fortuitum]